MKRFFSRLNYSFGNEDWKVERKALKIEPHNHVLCITASGDRPLHLLLDDCQKITSIDANQVQNHLLHLKSAAMQTLDYNEYVRFLGALPTDVREKSFRKVLKQLDEETSRFWINQNNKIKKGIIYQGDVERLTRFVSVIASIFRPNKIKKLFEMDDLEAQKEFVKNQWDTKLMRKIFNLVLHQSITSFFEIDPGLYSNVAPNIKVGNYIYERMINALNTGLAKENMLISLIFRGYVGPEAFPPYLKYPGYYQIRDRVHKISVQTKDVITYLEESSSNSIDRFSLSDIASYMDSYGFNRMIKGIYETSKPNARFCIRQFSSDHQIPLQYKDHFVRETSLEKELEKEDHCFVYRFMVGTIKK